MSKQLTDADIAVVRAYKATPAKQRGNLHERMQYVMGLLKQHKNSVPNDLWHAIWDLETEVGFTSPANPPYAKRVSGD